MSNYIAVDKDWKAPRKCDICGGTYTPAKALQRYCCLKCKRRGARVLRHPDYKGPGAVYEKTCPECGTPFTTTLSYHKYDKDICRYAVNSRMKYWRDKKIYPEMSKHHADRRNSNHAMWQERMHTEGRCTRCGELLPEADGRAVCDICRMNMGK